MYFSMLNKDAIELARRHKEAYNEYFGKIPEESLLAFMLNPLLVTKGSAEIIALMGSDNGNEIIKDAKRVLVKELKKVLESETSQDMATEEQESRDVDKGGQSRF